MFSGMSVTAIWAVLLPPVKESLYFHKKKTDDTSMAQSTATIYNPKKFIESSELSIETLSIEQVYKSCKIKLLATMQYPFNVLTAVLSYE